MAKSITEQIEDLQHENEQLKQLHKLFEKAVKNEFGCDAKTIRKALENKGQSDSNFEKKIEQFFNLKTPADKEAFLSIICSDSTLNFYKSKRTGESV